MEVYLRTVVLVPYKNRTIKSHGKKRREIYSLFNTNRNDQSPITWFTVPSFESSK